jgi:hypothetical protein
MFPKPCQSGWDAEDKAYDDQSEYVRSKEIRPLRTDSNTDE